MLRSLLRVGAALAFAALLAPATPSAQPAPGLAYDEIVRVVVNATPPPPGNFQSDLAALGSSPQAAATPAPRRGIGIGAIAGAVLGGGGGAGGIAGNVAGVVASNALENALSAQLGATFGALAASLNAFLQPHLTRYAYWNGWERVEDVSAQTATIRKCDIGQVVRLDLAKKTYSVYDPASEPTPAPPGPARAQPRQRAASAEPAPPGTVVAELSVTTAALGPKTIENQNTAGYDATATFAMKQATGSCRNGSASIKTTEYLAPQSRPAVTACPLRPRAPIPQSANEVVTANPRGGCTPTLTTKSSGPSIPTNRLSLYTLVTMTGSGDGTPAPAPSGASGGIGFLTERGNLRPLGAPDASIFEIPAGFTKTP
jgi:hypothetical protein